MTSMPNDFVSNGLVPYLYFMALVECVMIQCMMTQVSNGSVSQRLTSKACELPRRLAPMTVTRQCDQASG